MAEIVLRLVRNHKTGKRDITIDYRGDGDALPMEHETAHKEVVDKVLEGRGAKVTRDSAAVAEIGKTAQEPTSEPISSGQT